MNRALLYSIKLGLPLALLAYLLWSVDRADYHAFWTQPKRWDRLAWAQLLSLLAILIGILRWRLLVRCFDIPFSTREALRLGFLGYLLNFVSLGSVGGDFFKAILVAKEKRSKRPEAVASVLLDRAIGLLGLIMLAWFSIYLLPAEELPRLIVAIGQAAGVLTVLSSAGLLLAIYAGSWFDRWIDWGQRNVPWVGSPVARMARATRLLRHHPAALPLLIGSSLVVHAMLTVSVYLVSWGLYSEAPSLQAHFVVVPPAMAAGALPLAPGGLGVQEGAIVALFRMLPDLPPAYSAVLVATVFRLITIAIAGVGMGYYLASHGREMRYAKQAAEEIGQAL